MSEVGTSSQPFPTGTDQQPYKQLLNQQCQKLWKQLPVYRTLNEGSDHQPKFRTTISIWVDGVSFTSPNTFPQRKMAELDASRITLAAIMHKLKTDASYYVLHDKTFCKSIVVEYAQRMNKKMTKYRTTQWGFPVPSFQSCLDFNGDTYTGDVCKTKQEAEKSAAQSVILKCLDSESGNILSEIITNKFNHHHQTSFSMRTVVAQTPTNNPPTNSLPPSLGQLDSVPITNPSFNEVQPTNPSLKVTPSIPHPSFNEVTPRNPSITVTPPIPHPSFNEVKPTNPSITVTPSTSGEKNMHARNQLGLIYQYPPKVSAQYTRQYIE